MGPNCLQRSSTDDTSKQRFKEGVVCRKMEFHVYVDDFHVSAGGGRL